MSIVIKAIPYGLVSILGLGGILLIALGYQNNNNGEVGTGEFLVGLAVFLWVVALVARLKNVIF